MPSRSAGAAPRSTIAPLATGMPSRASKASAKAHPLRATVGLLLLLRCCYRCWYCYGRSAARAGTLLLGKDRNCPFDSGGERGAATRWKCAKS